MRVGRAPCGRGPYGCAVRGLDVDGIVGRPWLVVVHVLGPGLGPLGARLRGVVRWDDSSMGCNAAVVMYPGPVLLAVVRA